MIQFFIAGQEVILPHDFSFTQIEQNPLITANGEFTLDMTISLKNARNARAMKHINRLNKISVDSNYDALMIDDGVYKYGSIIIQNYTNADLTFQFVAGNSELNYVSNADSRKIWELDWGMETEITYERAMDSIQNPGYHYKVILGKPIVIEKRFFTCPPVRVGTDIANEYILSDAIVSNTTAPATLTKSVINDVRNIVMQPYLMYYIIKLPSLLGYTLNTNCLANDVRAKNMYVVNAVRSLNYADALPDMTISEFITEIENFFNVVFKVDTTSKSIDIVSKSIYVQNFPKKKLTNVLDEFNVEHKTEEDANKLGWTKLSFDLSGSGLLKYQFIKQEVLDKLSLLEYADINQLLSHNFTPENYNKPILYRDNETGRDYVYSRDPDDMIYQVKNEITGVSLYYVNKFASYGSGDNELVLKIVPAEIVKELLIVKTIIVGTGGYSTVNYTYNYQLPKSSLGKIADVETQNVMDYIEDDLYAVPRSNKLEVSMIMKPINLFSVDSDFSLYQNTLYPFSYIDTVPEYGYEVKLPYNSTEDQVRWNRWTTWRQTEFTPNAKATLRINGLKSLMSDYHAQSVLDLSKLYYFSMPDSKDITTKYIYEYKNQDYMPIELERTKSREKGLVKGTFYRML